MKRGNEVDVFLDDNYFENSLHKYKASSFTVRPPVIYYILAILTTS